MRMARLFWGLCLLIPVLGLGQKRFGVTYKISTQVRMPFRLMTDFSGRTQAVEYIDRLPQRLMGSGHFAASVDSVQYAAYGAVVWLYPGPVFTWSRLGADPVAAEWLKRMGIDPTQVTGSISPDSLRQQLLDFMADRGYPFASVTWDSLTITDTKMEGRLQLEQGPFYKLDSIVQQGKRLFRKNFLYNYLQLRPGMPYHHTWLSRADERLVQLPYVQLRRPSSVDMLGTGCLLSVDLESRKSNIFNVLLGVMPISSQVPGSGVMITGDAQILLRNALGNGETIGAVWQQLQYKSPRIQLQYEQPYVWNGRTGLQFQFDMFRKDSQFVQVQARLAVPYQISRYQLVRVMYQWHQNNVGFYDTAWIKTNRRLPDIADFTAAGLGMEWEYNRTNNINAPVSGTYAQVQLTASRKIIRRSSQVSALADPLTPGSDFGYLYDRLNLNTYQLRWRGRLDHYFPVGSRQVVKAAFQGGWIQSGNYLRNELFQVGGFKTLRGFDEESIFCRAFGVVTAEWRYLTGDNSYFFAFTDGGWTNYRDEARRFSHTYMGAGAGLSIETGNARINISWAIGKRNDLPLEWRQSKIHIGFVNYF